MGRVLCVRRTPSYPTAMSESPKSDRTAEGGSDQRLVRRCDECGRSEPGHAINCKTGNERAKAYQKGLETKYRKSRKSAPNADALAPPPQRPACEKDVPGG